MKKILNEGNLIHNFISSSGSGTVIVYGSGSDCLTSYGSGSTSQQVTVLTVPVPVPQHCRTLGYGYSTDCGLFIRGFHDAYQKISVVSYFQEAYKR
jgi:hypothetical protein